MLTNDRKESASIHLTIFSFILLLALLIFHMVGTKQIGEEWGNLSWFIFFAVQIEFFRRGGFYTSDLYERPPEIPYYLGDAGWGAKIFYQIVLILDGILSVYYHVKIV